MASMAIARILFSSTVTDPSSILRHKKTSALILGSLWIVIFIGKDAHFIVVYHISLTFIVLKTQLVLSDCGVNLLEVTYLQTLQESSLWTKVISNLAYLLCFLLCYINKFNFWYRLFLKPLAYSLCSWFSCYIQSNKLKAKHHVSSCCSLTVDISVHLIRCLILD